MTDQKPDGVVETPAAVEVVEKKKRGRPKKEAGIKVPGKKRRDIYHEAFGDKRALVAVTAMKHGPDGKAIIAAVKLLGESAAKRAKLEKKREKLMDQNAAIVKKVEDLDAELVKFSDAGTAVNAFKGRVASMIDTIYGNPEPRPTPSPV